MQTSRRYRRQIEHLASRANQSLSLEQNILGIHEAATKLWTASLRKPVDRKTLGKRIASVIIASLAVADTLGVEDVESILQERVVEISKALDNDI